MPPDLRDLNYKDYFEEGNTKINEMDDYNSHNTNILSLEEMEEMLMKLPYIKQLVSNLEL